MAFNGKGNMFDERAPLIQTPTIWTRSHEYPIDSEFYGRAKRKQRFQWMVFIGVTVISIFILLAMIGAAAKMSDEASTVNPLAPGTGPPPTISTSTTTTSTTTQTPTV